MAGSDIWTPPLAEPLDKVTNDLIDATWMDDVAGNFQFLYKRRVIELLNNSGGQVIAGDVVVLDTTADSAFTTTTVAANAKVLGVAQETIASGATGKVQMSGPASVNVNGAVASRGMYLSTATGAKTASASSVSGVADFAVSIATTGSAGLCACLLRGPLPESSAYKKLGAGTATTNQTITSTATPGTDVSGMTVTCTPNGINDILVTVGMPDMTGDGAGVFIFVALQKNGTIVDTWSNASFNSKTPASIVFSDPTPANSSTIYKVSAWSASAQNISTIKDAVAVQNVILVEQIG